MRLPVLPTILVAAAVAAMVGLGIWQLQRSQWKQGLIARFEANQSLPETGWPAVPPSGDSLLYRRASGFCVEVKGWRAIAGRNRSDQPGWAHIAACRTGGAEGPGMQVDMGWSKSSAAPAWKGGNVTGTIVPDREHRIRLVSEAAAAGLEPSAVPRPADMPNNHLAYAVQWFLFAALAGIIYVLALRRRERPKDPESQPTNPQ